MPSRPRPPARRAPTDPVLRAAWRSLQEVPNIGPAMAHDLLRLGVRAPHQLAKENPQDLYDRISALDGVRHDPCVLDTFAAAVHFARTGQPLPWWAFTAQRKSGMAG